MNSEARKRKEERESAKILVEDGPEHISFIAARLFQQLKEKMEENE